MLIILIVGLYIMLTGVFLWAVFTVSSRADDDAERMMDDAED